MGEEQEPVGLFHQLVVFLNLIKFPHTVFALPFAFTGAILAAQGIPKWEKAFWILVAMVGARTGAMAVNRLVDMDLDALNPRTAQRALPRGLIRPVTVLTIAVCSFALLVFAAAQLNRLCLLLSPVAIALTVFYAYTKRFTTLSHLVLGLSLACAPIGAWIAVRGRVDVAPLVLGLAVLFWVAGFDILYALADIESDRTHGLYSIPARLGAEAGMQVSLGLHIAVPVLLGVVGQLLRLGPLYYLGILFVVMLLGYEHATMRRHGLQRLEMAFFNVNGLISITLFTFTLLDALIIAF
ncbi:MAG: putative 4-hydroxybenzoate polyprenyltransferase [candidate division NC10 bacterium]|nr:putative 4-hydroxybenzoate polyprenyltransferase [candidate division NC10 bacterium]